jgi:hypothetical protein
VTAGRFVREAAVAASVPILQHPREDVGAEAVDL